MTASAGKIKTPAREPARPARRRVVIPGGLGEAPLAAGFMDAAGALDLDRITRTFGMTRIQLAETTGLGRDTFQKAARQNAPKTRARVSEMLEIVGRIEQWAGGRPQAMAWYRAQPIAALDGRTAEALVKSGRAGAVRDYLDHIALGGFA